MGQRGEFEGSWTAAAGLGVPEGVRGARLGCPILTRCPGEVGEPGSVPRVAFSASLSSQRVERGTIPFDQVLLNDGGAYDPETGERHRHTWGTGTGAGGCMGAALGWAGGYSWAGGWNRAALGSVGQDGAALGWMGLH